MKYCLSNSIILALVSVALVFPADAGLFGDKKSPEEERTEIQDQRKKILEKITSGNVLEVVFDNPSSSESISAMCRNDGHDIFDKSKNGGKYVYKIRKK